MASGISTLEQLDAEAQALMTQELWEQAIAVIERVAAEGRSLRMNWHHGWALFRLERYVPAAQSFRRAVLQDGTSALNHWGLGVSLKQCGDLEAAERHLLRALSIKDSGMTRLNLAVLYMRQDRFDDAERVHLEGIERRPTDRERVEAYADFLDDCGRLTEATELYAKAETLPKKDRKPR